MAETTNRGYPLFDLEAFVEVAGPLLLQALEMVDGDIHQLMQAISTLAPAEHQHGIDDVTDLQLKLDAKSDGDHGHTLGELTNVSPTADTAPVGSILWKSVQGWVVGNPATVLGAHQHTIGNVEGLAAELAAKATIADLEAKFNALLGAAPAQLDTLVELAAALGNDGNYAATTTAALAARLRKDQNLADLPNVATARANLGVSYPLQHKGDLGNSSHLDDIIASGLYSKHSGEAATLEKGFPFGSAGTLRVFNTDLAGGRDGFIIQEYDTIDMGRWRRTHANPAGWRPWVKQYTGAITISTAAPSGGADGDIWHQV